MKNHQPFNTVGETGYLNVMRHILENGYKAENRTGTDTIVSPTPHQLHFPNVGQEFPLVTTKYVSFNMLAAEMLWFISGSTNTRDLARIGSPAMKKVWDKWADENGDLGPVYGYQWRHWEKSDSIGAERVREEDGYLEEKFFCEIDQLQEAIRMIRENPLSRRIIVSAWNPVQIGEMALPPCHMMFKFRCEPLSLRERSTIYNRDPLKYADHGSLIMRPEKAEESLDHMGVPKYRLYLHMFQRSCDMFLGVPFNIAEYALLLLLAARITNCVPGDYTWTGDDCHIYEDHVDAVETQLAREPYSLPKVTFNPRYPQDIDGFAIEYFNLENYKHHPVIKAEVSV